MAQKDKLLGLLSDVDVLTLNKEEMQQLVSGEDLEALVRRRFEISSGRFGDGRCKWLNCKRWKNHRASANVRR